jgi:hypothetical protein
MTGEISSGNPVDSYISQLSVEKKVQSEKIFGRNFPILVSIRNAVALFVDRVGWIFLVRPCFSVSKCEKKCFSGLTVPYFEVNSQQYLFRIP